MIGAAISTPETLEIWAVVVFTPEFPAGADSQLPRLRLSAGLEAATCPDVHGSVRTGTFSRRVFGNHRDESINPVRDGRFS
jgi:hypothetical protein